MTDARQLPSEVNTPTAARWSVGGLFLEALAQRDYAKMSECFEPEATMRALLPGGPAEFRGAAQIAQNFQSWFGNAEDFEVLDGTVGEVGDRLHLAWRLRLRPTPWGDDHWHVIEQQAYARAAERVDTLDLLCSGFMPDDHG
jgi:hypothetical protein